MLPFAYDALQERFATIRPWAKNAIGEATNRCAICMGYTLRLTPLQDDATIQAILNGDVRTSFEEAPPLAGGPRTGVLPGSGQPLRGLIFIFFIVLFVQWVRASMKEAERVDRRLDREEARARASGSSPQE